MEKILITQKEDNVYLCHICGKTLGSMDTLKRHLKCHETYNCPTCKYPSLRRDAVKRHSLKHKRDQCRSSVTVTYSYQVDPDLQYYKLNLINQIHPKLTAIYINKNFIETKKSSCEFYMNLTPY